MVKRWSGLCRAGLCLILSGCISLPGFPELKPLPGFQQAPLKEELLYDKAILAYRVKDEDDSKRLVLRNAVGKKIQTEQELNRYISNVRIEAVGSGTRYPAYALAGIYTPFNFATGLFYVVPTVPLIMAGSAVVAAYRDKAETAYRSGRAHFSRGELKEALIEWDRAKAVAPELQAISDVEYWRGRALQQRGQGSEALIAYQHFLGYSERAQPEFFTTKDASDMTWEEEAYDIERRLAGAGHAQ